MAGRPGSIEPPTSPPPIGGALGRRGEAEWDQLVPNHEIPERQVLKAIGVRSLEPPFGIAIA